jgi:hypothetical protein
MPQKSQIFGNTVVAHLPMFTFLSVMVSFLSFRVRSRASLELEVIALRHQLSVPKRQRPSRARLFRADRLPWILLYRIWPQAIHAMVLVKPTTVLEWHRRGFRLAWRWRSGARRPGRPPRRVRGSRLNSSNVYSESAVGRTSDSWRAAQAWYRGESGHCRKIHAMATERALPHLAQLPANPHDGHRRRSKFAP